MARRKRREMEVFSLSFLDCISCGFGAVVLLFIIINSQVAARANQAGREVQGETSLVEEDVLAGRKDLAQLRARVRAERERQALAEAEAKRIEDTLATLRADLEDGPDDSVARKESAAQLQADIKQLEEANKRLTERAAQAAPERGERVRSFTGDGNRQYLTGIRLDGNHVLVLVDASTSMLGRTYVNVFRFRSMDDARKRRAPKWRQAVRTVDWLTSQLKPGQNVALYRFDETATGLGGGGWISARDNAALERAVAELRQVVPGRGTSFINAFAVIEQLNPRPDNIFFITDGLPTQGEKAPSVVEDIAEERRVKYMVDAVRGLPRRLPVNVMLLPMDGDPRAAGYFWDLAVASGGSLLTPSQDWP
jgi:hypothetical protein